MKLRKRSATGSVGDCGRCRNLAGSKSGRNDCDIRFDAILVAPGKIPRHIPAAFEAN
jgi:hypothetical protein